MIVNKQKILFDGNNKTINIPIEMNWDFGGRDDLIEKYEEDVIREVIGSPNDFETIRFSNKDYTDNLGNSRTDINYEFNFFSGGTYLDIPTSNINDWGCSYLIQNFTNDDLYYYRKPFTKSFFKLDLYDTKDLETQQIYLTIIIPVQQGLTETVDISPILSSVNIKKPFFKLDFIGDKEGYFIYWLRKRDYIDIDTFYMTSKFFNATIGEYITLLNRPQSSFPLPFTFDQTIHSYYKVKLDYASYTYEIIDNITNQRVGDTINPIKWYEYINAV